MPARSLSLRVAPVAAVALLLSACGETRSERALSGAGIGAGLGAAGAAATGGGVLTGAVLGGAAGAAVGVLTDDEDLRIRRPRF